MQNWTLDSWRQFPALQQPEYPDPAALDRVLAELRQLPPLVVSWEIVQLREQLAEAAGPGQFTGAPYFVQNRPLVTYGPVLLNGGGRPPQTG